MMANVLHPTIDFHPRPVSHAPSPFGFGFGLNSGASSSMSSPGWGSATPGHTNHAAFHQLASSVSQLASTSKSQKRRLDPEDEHENGRLSVPRDENMDRSPTPERPKRTAPKRARLTSTPNVSSKGDNIPKDSKGAEEEDNVDIGVLLAGLPPQSLLPILSGLLKMQPSLKSIILPLIPRPSLQEAIETLKQATKKLQEAYPFSNTSAFSTHHSFGVPQQPAMRNDYILSRIRPHVTEFVSTCSSYFPYFSYKPSIPSSSSKHNLHLNSSPATHSLQKEKFHPAESFAFLSAVTKIIIDQPSLVISELEPLILPRLSEEWRTWVENLDRHAHGEGNMVAPSLARSWELEIERLIDGKSHGISNLMRGVLEHFPLKQGWGFSSRTPQMMVEP